MWKYGLKKKMLDCGTEWYELTEIYGEDCYTEDVISISGETTEQIIDNLEVILSDLKNNLTIIDIKDK